MRNRVTITKYSYHGPLSIEQTGCRVDAEPSIHLSLENGQPLIQGAHADRAEIN
jgi:hypothetical protein